MYWKNQWNGEQKTLTLLEVVLPMVSWTVKFFASTTYCSLRKQIKFQVVASLQLKNYFSGGEKKRPEIRREMILKFVTQ